MRAYVKKKKEEEEENEEEEKKYQALLIIKDKGTQVCSNSPRISASSHEKAGSFIGLD